MKIYAETERLILRELLPSDVDGMFELDSDPEVHKYLGNKPVQDKQQIVAVIDFIRKQYVDYGIGRWAIMDKKTDEFMGWAGLKYVTEETNGQRNFYDLGYRLIRRHWGKGIATEAAQASLEYGFNDMKLEKLHGIADCQNIGSNKILTKIGFNLVDTFNFDDIPCNWYTIVKPAV